MNNKNILAAGVLAIVSALRAGAASTPLPLRYEQNGVYLQGGVLASQTVENSYGTEPMTLPFPGPTNSYDFYSPPLLSALSLTTSEKGGGMIAVTNSAPASANDFQVGGMMYFYDYDPVEGSDTQIVIAGQAISPPQNATHGQTIQWTLIQNPLPANYTIAAGHSLHIKVTLAVISGNPGSYAQLVYNGPSTATTVGQLPQNVSLSGGWPFGPVVPSIMSVTPLSDPAMLLTCVGTPGKSYLVQATTNLTIPSSWLTIGTNTVATNGLFQFIDNDAPNYSCRFYRLKTP